MSEQPSPSGGNTGHGIVDQIICHVGYLFPLWDAKRQTLADKIMPTVCLPV